MIIPFKQVGINERFTFVSQYRELCTSGIKISARKYVMDNGTKCTIGDSKFPCDVDNSCVCTEPRPLTFNDLSIGSIFIISSTWYAQVDNEHKYCKLDNMHYCNFYDSRLFTISSINIVVATPDYVQYAQ